MQPVAPARPLEQVAWPSNEERGGAQSQFDIGMLFANREQAK